MSDEICRTLDTEIASLQGELEQSVTYKKLIKAKELLSLYEHHRAPPIALTKDPKDAAPAPPTHTNRSREETAIVKRRILKAVDQYFDQSNGPLKSAAIYAAIQRSGLPIPGKTPKNNLSAMLSNSTEFVSTRDGWVRAGSDLDPTNADTGDKVTEASDALTSEASNREEPTSHNFAFHSATT